MMMMLGVIEEKLGIQGRGREAEVGQALGPKGLVVVQREEELGAPGD
jgi:hypothetical protein